MPASDYKKQYKDLYMPPEKPVLVEVPAMNFLTVDGTGDPNGQEFEDAVGALYSLSYTLKMLPKKGIVPQGYVDYTVPPLEGLWWIPGMQGFDANSRDQWAWRAMIRQPEFVTAELVASLLPEAKKKKPNPKLDALRLEAFEEGLSVQIMHLGPYSTEPASLDRLEEFIRENGLVNRLAQGAKHHEIYLTDPRRGKPENTKTVLRHPVARV